MAIVPFHLEHKTMNCLCPFQLTFQRKSASDYTVSSLLKSDYLKQRFKFVVFKKILLRKNGKWHQVVMDVPTLLPLAGLVSISQHSLQCLLPELMVTSLWNKF